MENQKINNGIESVIYFEHWETFERQLLETNTQNKNHIIFSFSVAKQVNYIKQRK